MAGTPGHALCQEFLEARTEEPPWQEMRTQVEALQAIAANDSKNPVFVRLSVILNEIRAHIDEQAKICKGDGDVTQVSGGKDKDMCQQKVSCRAEDNERQELELKPEQERERSKLELELEQTREQLKESELELKQMMEGDKALRRLVGKYQREVGDLQILLEDTRLQARDLKAENRRQEEELQRQSVEAGELEAENRLQGEELERQFVEVGGLRNQLAHSQQEVGDLQTRLADSQREVGDLENRLADCQREIRRDDELFDEQGAELDRREDEVSDLTYRLAQRQREVDDLRAVNFELRQDLEEYQAGLIDDSEPTTMMPSDVGVGYESDELEALTSGSEPEPSPEAGQP